MGGIGLVLRLGYPVDRGCEWKAGLRGTVGGCCAFVQALGALAGFTELRHSFHIR